MAQCTATNRQGSQCGKSAIPGGEVCRLHGGAAPQTMAKARLRLAEQEAAKVLADLGAEDLDRHPLEVLTAVLAEQLRLAEYLRAKVELEEPTGAEWALIERTWDRLTKGAEALIKFDLTDRALVLREQQAAVIAHVLDAVLGDMGLQERRAEVVPLVEHHLLALAS